MKADNTGHYSKRIINPVYEELNLNVKDGGKNKTRAATKNSGLVEDEETYIEDKNQIQIGQKIYILKFKSKNKKGNIDAVSA